MLLLLLLISFLLILLIFIFLFIKLNINHEVLTFHYSSLIIFNLFRFFVLNFSIFCSLLIEFLCSVHIHTPYSILQCYRSYLLIFMLSNILLFIRWQAIMIRIAELDEKKKRQSQNMRWGVLFMPVDISNFYYFILSLLYFSFTFSLISIKFIFLSPRLREFSLY
jgi:hypothetical protein